MTKPTPLPYSAPRPTGQVRDPPIVKKALGAIRAGVKAALQKSCSSLLSSPRGDLPGVGKTAAVAFPPISPRDLLEGTCLRFGTTHDRGVLGVDDLRQVWLSVFLPPALHSWWFTPVFGWCPAPSPGHLPPSLLPSLT